MASRQLIDIILRITKQGTGLQETKRELDEVGKTGGRAESAFSKISSSVGKLGIAVGGAAIAFGTLKKAWDFAKEGAAILQTKESFDRLMGSMGVAPDILGRLRDASRGTVDDMTIMSSTMTLLAGTSERLGSAMVDAAPQLMEIAKAAHKLNPTLGDTSFLYQSLATGIKRSSPLILDNLGLVVKVGDANEAMAAKLGKTVEQLNAEEKQMALLNATLEAGGRMLEQVGGSTEEMGDKFAEAETKIKNAWDTIKTKLTPVLAELAEGLAAELSPAAERGAQLFDNMGMTAEEAARHLGAFDEKAHALAEETDRVSEKWQTYANTLKEEALPATTEMTTATFRAAEASSDAAYQIREQARAEEEAAEAADDFKASMDSLSFAMGDSFANAAKEFQSQVAQIDVAMNAGNIPTMQEYNRLIMQETESIKENTRAIAFNIAEKQILDALEKGLIEDVNNSGTAFDEVNTILWTLAETLGLTDEQQIAFMQSVQEATGAVIEGDMRVETYAGHMKYLADQAAYAIAEVDGVAASINALPDVKRISIEVTTTYSGGTEFEGTEGEQGHGMGGGDAYNMQHGGQFRVRGPAGVDRVPVRFMATRGEVVTVTPVGGTPPLNPAVTNNFNLNVTSTQPSAGIIQDFGIMQDLIQ